MVYYVYNFYGVSQTFANRENTSFLNTGYDVENNISISYSGPDVFNIYINSELECDFSDTSFSSGSTVFITVVYQQQAEDCRFKQTFPVPVPY